MHYVAEAMRGSTDARDILRPTESYEARRIILASRYGWLGRFPALPRLCGLHESFAVPARLWLKRSRLHFYLEGGFVFIETGKKELPQHPLVVFDLGRMARTQTLSKRVRGLLNTTRQGFQNASHSRTEPTYGSKVMCACVAG